MKIADNGKYSIYVYREVGQPHNLPHCHLRWVDKAAVVSLPTLHLLVGASIPRDAKQFLKDYLDTACDAWDKMNPERSV